MFLTLSLHILFYHPSHSPDIFFPMFRLTQWFPNCVPQFLGAQWSAYRGAAKFFNYHILTEITFSPHAFRMGGHCDIKQVLYENQHGSGN